MSKINCDSCSNLREYAPNFIANGVTDDVCASLAEDTGLNDCLNPLHTDCDDLHDANDCLIGTMDAQIEAHEVCDWKEYMHKLVPNLYEVIKAIICAICGIWENIHKLWDKINCTYNGIKKLVSALNESTLGGSAFVRYVRDNSGTATGVYEWPAPEEGMQYTADFYMDADVDDHGSKPADRDYVVIIHNCTNFHNFTTMEVLLTWYSSLDTRTVSTIRRRQAQHPCVKDLPVKVSDWSWTTSAAVLVKKGGHVKLNAYVNHTSGGDAWFRVHQIAMTWIPVNAEASGVIDIKDILPC